MAAPSKQWEMPNFTPYWNIRIVAHGYLQWVHEGRPPLIPPDFMERVLNADMEAKAHFQYIDDMIEFEGNNASKADMADFLQSIGYEQ